MPNSVENILPEQSHPTLFGRLLEITEVPLFFLTDSPAFLDMLSYFKRCQNTNQNPCLLIHFGLMFS